MNTKALNALAGVICRAQEQDRTPMGIAFAVDSAGMHMSPETAAELERLRSLLNAQPVELSERQIDALSAVGNRAVNDATHEDLCMCDAWPEKCLSSGGYFQGYWDSAALDTAMPAVIGLWESMRADAQLAELERLRARVAELEAQRKADHETWQHDLRTARGEREATAARIAELESERHSTNEALSDAAERMRADRDRIAELERQLADAPLPVTLTAKAAESANKLTALFAPTQALRADADGAL